MDGEEIRKILGKNIRKFRDRRGWSQADLSEYSNVSVNYLGEIERGLKWPFPDTMSKLADALEINVYELFCEEKMDLTIGTKLLMRRFLNDVSIVISKSLSMSVNQSIETIQKQYKLDKNSKIYEKLTRKELDQFAAEIYKTKP